MPISQMEFVTYTRYLGEIKVIEQCCSKREVDRIGILDGRFIKLDVSRPCSHNFNAFFEKFSPNELDMLGRKVTFINNIHCNLAQADLRETSSGDCAALAAEFYNTNRKVLSAWNDLSKKQEWHIVLPTADDSPLDPLFSEKTTAQIADVKALDRYFELLEEYPKLKREGDLNDHTKGTYEIIFDRQQILTIRKEIFERIYEKAKTQGSTPLQARQWAEDLSRPGIVCEDQFWLWIRDVVIAPSGYRHTYNRMLWKNDLNNIVGAAALPVVLENGNKKLILQLAFRHATQSWEFEMARGGSKANETPITTARREILEETGCETDRLIHLGDITPDSGLTASVVPIFLGEVTREGKAQQDKTEAIKGTYAFTLAELMEGFKNGGIEVEISGQITFVPLRDPFLAYALLRAQHEQLL